MNFDRGTVKANSLHFNFDDALYLKRLEHTLQHAILAPSIHAYINCMPIPVFFRQCSPLAAVFGDIQYRINQLEITHAYISTLAWKVFFNLFVLLLCYFHALIITRAILFVN